MAVGTKVVVTCPNCLTKIEAEGSQLGAAITRADFKCPICKGFITHQAIKEFVQFVKDFAMSVLQGPPVPQNVHVLSELSGAGQYEGPTPGEDPEDGEEDNER